jgi:uncharacterized membrane protein
MALPDPVSPSPPPHRAPTSAGGCLIALGATAGPVIGLFFGQTTLGLVIGLGAGAVGAVLWAVFDRRG